MGRRDRHARSAHPDADRRRRPSAGFRLRSRASFDRVVRDALAELAEPVGQALEGVPVDVRDVPAGDMRQSPIAGVDSDGQRIRRLSIHRRPAEQRAADRIDLTDLVRDAIELAVADALGLDPDGWSD
jgi:hypothetical protein